MRGMRMKRDMNGANASTTTTLIQPKMENLTIGPIPTDATNVVLSRPNDLGITDKLNALITEYQSEMVQLPSTGTCASAITAKFPREFLQALYDMLNVNNNGCLQETQTFLQLLISYLSSTTEGYINIPRNFWTQIGRVFNELNVNESKINMYAAAMRSMAMALSTDVQSIPSNNMLISTLESISELDDATVKPIDSQFEEDYPESILEQPDPNEVMTEVINNIPTTVGESSSNPPTNIIDMDASTSSENIQLHDLDDTVNLEGQAYIGLKDLFSMKTLGVPISKLKLIEGGMVKSFVLQDIQVPSTGTLNADGKKVDFTFTDIKAYVQQEIPLEGIDVSKSIIEQDWSLIPDGTLRLIDGKLNYISTTSLITKTSQRILYPEGTMFKGVNTKRTYTMPEAMSLASSLGGLWNKVVSMKLPSPAHIQTGTSILAAGLGAAGSIFGSSGLVTASKVVGSLNEGLGSFIANLKPANGLTPSPQASITKNALTVVPGIVEAGKSIYEGISVSAQQQRIKLSGMKNAVESGYIMPSSELTLRSRVRRYNNVFV